MLNKLETKYLAFVGNALVSVHRSAKKKQNTSAIHWSSTTTE